MPKIPFLSPKGESSSKPPKRKLLENPRGISTVYTPPGPHKIDIIFTHGLGGGSRKTWSHDPCDLSTFWPGQWLPLEEEFGDARIHTFGYNADFHGDPTMLAILDFGRDLIQALKFSSLGFGEVPIILVGHSMGGLVSKKAYILGKNNPKEYSQVTKAIKAMLFLATPHQGSSHSKVLNKILGIVPTKARQQYVNDLNVSSVTIRTIDELFRSAIDDLMLASLYEVFPLKIAPLYSKMIVEKHHAILGVPDEIVRPMDANHRTICKFHSKMDPNYVAVRNVLMTLMLQILADEKRKDYVDPFTIPPFKGNRKQEGEGERGVEKGKGRDVTSMNGGAIYLTTSGFVGSNSSCESLSDTAFVPSTSHTIPMNESPRTPLSSHIPNKNVTSGASLRGAEGAGTCSHCAHCMGKDPGIEL